MPAFKKEVIRYFTYASKSQGFSQVFFCCLWLQGSPTLCNFWVALFDIEQSIAFFCYMAYACDEKFAPQNLNLIAQSLFIPPLDATI